MRRHLTIAGARLDLALVFLLVIASATPSRPTTPAVPVAAAAQAPVAAAAAAPVAAAAAAPSPATPLVGTVRSVDLKVRTLEVLTGVGHAFRLVRMQVAADCDIRDTGVPAELKDIHRGRIVRVRFVAAPSARAGAPERIAVSIDALPPPEAGGGR